MSGNIRRICLGILGKMCYDSVGKRTEKFLRLWTEDQITLEGIKAVMLFVFLAVEWLSLSDVPSTVMFYGEAQRPW